MVGRARTRRSEIESYDLICCATTAREPLFDGARVADHATVVAIGSHERDAREVDSALAGRATVVVESRATALREAGDVVMAIAEGALDADALIELGSLVRGAAPPSSLGARASSSPPGWPGRTRSSRQPSSPRT